jgi:ABC-type multidrug transport system fused ATPase/permease subunit
MRFFDANPSGRIINRFSSDIETIDQKIPREMSDALFCLVQVLTAFHTLLNSIILNAFFADYFAALVGSLLHSALLGLFYSIPCAWRRHSGS